MYVVIKQELEKRIVKILAVQDIKMEKVFFFIDPHGSAVSGIFITNSARANKPDVIYFNPGDEMYPMGFNILDAKALRLKIWL